MKKNEDLDEFIDVIKRFTKLNRKLSPIFIVTIVLILSENFLKTFNNILLGRIADNATLSNMGMIIKGIIILGVLQIFRGPLNYFVTYYVNKLSEECIKRMRKYTYGHIARGSMKWLDSSKTGDILTRVNNDLGAMTSSVNQFLTVQVSSVISFVVGLIACFLVDWKISLISFIIIPIFAILQAKTGQPIAKLSRKRSEAEGQSISVFVDFLNGLTISKAFGLENAMYEKYEKSVDKSVKYNVKSFSIEFLMLPLQMLMGLFPQLVMLSVGSYFVIKGDTTLGGLLSFIFLSSSVTGPINSLSFQIRDIYNLSGISSRIFKIWDMELENEGGELTEKLSTTPVVFKNVQFGYDSANMILDNINFSINECERVALVGTSGSGKSTILKLITCFYSKTQGQIDIFGDRIEAWNIRSLRQQISYVGQDAFLFPGSIYDNVMLGQRDAKEDEIKKVIEMVGLNKLDIYSELGERGVKLSGGQRQRVCIARAILKNAPLVILDEPTSALDTESEYYVTRALEKLMKDKACIIVAHRLSAIRNVDRIICMDRGVIVQEGSHSELINQEGLYKRLYENQAKEGAIYE